MKANWFLLWLCLPLLGGGGLLADILQEVRVGLGKRGLRPRAGSPLGLQGSP